MNNNRNALGQYIKKENIIDWHLINFWDEYVPYFETHTREETLKHFNVSIAFHKSMCRYYNYKKAWNKIHTTANKISLTAWQTIDFNQFKQFYEQHTRQETCDHFNISIQALKKICIQNNYIKPQALISQNISKQALKSGKAAAILKLANIDFYNDYLPYFESHTREETCKYFGLSPAAHKKFIKMYDYKKDRWLANKQTKKKILFRNRYFDSMPEVAVYIWALDSNQKVEIEPCYFIYYYDNKAHKYIPDFKINEKFIEIKGDYFFKPDGTMCNPYDHTQDGLYEAKHQCMLTNNIEIWTSIQYTKAIDYCLYTYGDNWFSILNN